MKLQNRPWLVYATAIFVGLSAFWLFVKAASLLPGLLSVLSGVLLPVTLGLCIGYLLLAPVRRLERLYVHLFPKASPKATNALSVVTLYLLIFGMLALGIVVWVPQLLRNLADLGLQLPAYLDSAELWLNQLIAQNPSLHTEAVAAFIDQQLQQLSQNASAWLTTAIESILTGLFGTVVYLGKLALGIIASLYLLLERRSLAAGCSRYLHNLVGQHRLQKIIDLLKEVDSIFGRFLSARLTESLAVFLIAWVGFAALGIPYAALLGALTGIFNLIPYFGAFLAWLISLLVTALSAPHMIIWMTLFVVLLQMLDAWLIAPMLYGERLQLSGFMVIIAITVFGGLFGIWGMAIGVPCFALLLVSLQRVARKAAARRASKQATQTPEA